LEEGQIALVAMPQSNGQYKQRPVLLLRKFPGYGDFLVCGISSQLRQEILGFDVLLDEKHSDYTVSGLRKASVVRLSFLTVMPSKEIAGAIGKISGKTHRLILERLSAYLLKK
jgi:mRNA interferase MazF